MSNAIPLSQAIEMTTRYRTEKENILADAYKGQNILAISETFNRDVFDQVLGLSGCIKLRVYYGMDTTLKVRALVVGVNANDEDILPAAGTTTTLLADGDVIEEGQICPPTCPPSSPLNP